MDLFSSRSFNQTEAQFSKATLNRAATCIQRWWRGFSVRSRWRHMKEEVSYVSLFADLLYLSFCSLTKVQSFGLTWVQFSSRYRQVIERLQQMRQADDHKFLFKLDQARDFLLREKSSFSLGRRSIASTLGFLSELEVIFQSLSFNDKLDDNELELFFERCDLSASKGELEEAARIVLQRRTPRSLSLSLVIDSLSSLRLDYPQKKADSLTREMVFDIVYYIYPPLGTGLPSSRQSTWVRPIIDGEDETAIQGLLIEIFLLASVCISHILGTPFLEPIDVNVIYKFLGKS